MIPCVTPARSSIMAPIPFPEPCYSVAIAPKTRGQEDKIAQAWPA